MYVDKPVVDGRTLAISVRTFLEIIEAPPSSRPIGRRVVTQLFSDHGHDYRLHVPELILLGEVLKILQVADFQSKSNLLFFCTLWFKILQDSSHTDPSFPSLSEDRGKTEVEVEGKSKLKPKPNSPMSLLGEGGLHHGWTQRQVTEIRP
jgi:hypothetical protein